MSVGSPRGRLQALPHALSISSLLLRRYKERKDIGAPNSNASDDDNDDEAVRESGTHGGARAAVARP